MQMSRKDKRVLVVGRAGMDLYAEPVGTSIENANNFKSQLGGSAANIAAGLSAQGVKVNLLAGISNDAIGKFVKNSCNRLGIGTELLETIPKARNTLAIVDTMGESTQAIIYRNSPADLFLKQEVVDRIDLNRYKMLVTTGTALTEDPSRSAILKLMKNAKEKELEIIFDIDYRELTWKHKKEAEEILLLAAGYADIVVGNELEFNFMSKADSGGRSLAAQLTNSGYKISIYKMGSKGLYYFCHGKEKFVGSFQVNSIKPTGAGDGFLAGFCASKINGMPLEESIVFGSAMGAIVVTKVGCSEAMPDKVQVEEFLNIN